MKKLKLRVDTLAVESFDAGAELDATGTVHARGTFPTPPDATCAKTVLTYCPCTPAY